MTDEMIDMSEDNSFDDTTGAALVSAQDLHAWLQDGAELALVDVSEAGQYGEGHLLLAANIPFSELEPQIIQRVPRRSTRVVLVGAVAVVHRAAQRLRSLGYTHLHVLDGGLAAWAAAGYPVFKGIYVPSKAFAECVELTRHTPTLEPQALQQLLQQGDDVVVLDSRTAKEYARFHVPGAISCPGSELLYRLATLVPSRNTHVVISCAGRTRGIMGGQTLIDAQVPYRVSVLSGGTQGWKLAGFGVEQSAAEPLPQPEAVEAETALSRAQVLTQSLAIPVVGRHDLAQWQADDHRTTFLVDVRDPQEAKARPVPGAIAVAGVQLLQTTDTHVSVHGARIVLADDQGVRAHTTAYWLHQQGWSVAVLAAGDTFVASPAPLATDKDSVQAQRQALLRGTPVLTLEEVAQAIRAGAAVVSVQPSEVFVQGAVAGAVWSHRAAIAEGAVDAVEPKDNGVRLVIASDAVVGALAAQEWQARVASAQPVAVGVLNLGDWETLAQWGLVVDPNAPTLQPEQRVDFLYWLHDRHTGNAQASRQYLQWEAQLPAQIGHWPDAHFRIAQVQGG
ncbi:sulfurtransferase [Lampropedia puyangensis]|uniref:Sulfurtransferase n=1 Tax=Lampropedia puyangensis TaxID=1330072 RepID=A0A4S8EZ78_9BURK|nr:rhodanese-like domain-containing protein [Lampropedia puyangensis]THT98101.1 sulfurtransferase [Lampropedia puyangensis]